MYSKLTLWERKLEFLKQELEDIRNFNTSWFDTDQWSTYRQMVNKAENKVKEYEELVEYLREE
jgi:hypothetical protein